MNRKYKGRKHKKKYGTDKINKICTKNKSKYVKYQTNYYWNKISKLKNEDCNLK